MEENTLLIKKITFKHVFCFNYSKNFFINSIKHVFFLEQKLFSRIQFLNTFFFLLQTQKTVLKTYFLEQFSKIVTK